MMRRVLGRLSVKHGLVGAALTRVVLGTWAIYYYLLHLPVRGTLWGPHGIWPYDRFLAEHGPLNVWQLSASPFYADAVYAAAIVVALAFTLGLWSRLAAALHWLMIWSLQDRNPFIGDGGDNIMRIVLLFLILVDTGAWLSLDALRRRRVAAPRLRDEVLAVAHNFGVLLIVVQLSLLYMSTGLYKVMGELWQNGTAVYYILRVGEFSWPGVAELVYRNPYLVVLGTYGTVLFELLFLPSLWNRWTRYVVLAAGFFFHASIGLVMGLITFAWSMLSIYPLLVTDGEYAALQRKARERLELTVLYDGWCPLCTRSVRWFSCVDIFGVIDFVSFRAPGILASFDIDPGRAERRMMSVSARGRVREGMDVLLQLAARSVALWPLVPLLIALRLVGRQRAYDALARRRFILVPGGCADHCVLEGRHGDERAPFADTVRPSHG